MLEYLVKNGAERVIDEARSHMATIKILRNFHFIDEKGKDQGINGKLKFLIYIGRSAHPETVALTQTSSS